MYSLICYQRTFFSVKTIPSISFIFKEDGDTRKSKDGTLESIKGERAAGTGTSYLIQRSYEATALCGMACCHPIYGITCYHGNIDMSL